MVEKDLSIILILGGSYAGISTAHYLLKYVIPKLPDPSSYKVVLISASSQGICRPACPRAIISEDMFPQDKFFISIPPLFEHYPEKRTLSYYPSEDNTTESISFHTLIIATGASTASPLFSLNQSDAESLKKTWATFRASLPTAKSIVIAGGGPTAVETAGELAEYLNGGPGWSSWFGCKNTNPKVPITLVTSAPEILPVLRPSIAHQAEDALGRIGVSVIKGVRVAEVTPAQTPETLASSPVTVKLEDGRTLEADIYIPAVGTTPNTSFVREELLSPSKGVEINTSTFRVEKAGERVYAIGDVVTDIRASILNLAAGTPVLCANIKRDLLIAAGETSAGEDQVYKEDKRETQVVPIGRGAGVGAAMGFQMPGFIVRIIKGRDYFLGMLSPYWTGTQF
ncbi:hypothetical protein ARAM_003921 [Aspergillus rambellii]|uniref:FAD/NAD(P)-binding domain-containing protein n=1 Tax=Aspergillus rambellii TaxID=308745 RepID=A0A0F8UVI3_9EURO|nr:hypothetical protein ARAM_003921 [Aspergillus rambellii]